MVRAWPTTSKKITQQFGARPAYYKQFGLSGHEGIDIRAPHGTPIYAVLNGVVSRVDDNHRAYGIRVVIDHGDGHVSEYSHLSKRLVALGGVVVTGQQIGLSGDTGNADGAHLHWTVKRDGAKEGYPYGIIDPTRFLEMFMFDEFFDGSWTDYNANTQVPNGWQFRPIADGMIHATHYDRTMLPPAEHGHLNARGRVYLIKSSTALDGEWWRSIYLPKGQYELQVKAIPDWYDWNGRKIPRLERGEIELFVGNRRQRPRLSDGENTLTMTVNVDRAGEYRVGFRVIGKQNVPSSGGSNGAFIQSVTMTGIPDGTTSQESQQKPQPQGKFDLLPYLLSDGKIRPMTCSWLNGGEQPIQTVSDASANIRLVKGNEFQWHWYDERYIYFGADTSQSATEMYVLREDEQTFGSAWLPRYMAVGESYTRNPIVTHYEKGSGRKLYGGERVQTVMSLLRHHSTVAFSTGMQFHDVIEIGAIGGERHFFARGIGFVGWINDANGWKSSIANSSADSGQLPYTPIYSVRLGDRYFVPNSAESTPKPPPVEKPLPTQKPSTESQEQAVFGVDLSHHQNPQVIDYQALSSRYKFAVIRLGYGTRLDTAFDTHYQRCKEAGMKVASYWFVDSRFDAFDSGKLYAQTLASYRWDMLIGWADCEISITREYGNLTPSAEHIRNFADGFNRHSYIPLGVYTSPAYWKDHAKGATPESLGLSRHLWITRWGSDQLVIPQPYTQDDVVMIQSAPSPSAEMNGQTVCRNELVKDLFGANAAVEDSAESQQVTIEQLIALKQQLEQALQTTINILMQQGEVG